MAQVTRLGLHGGARRPYGSFAGREPTPEIVASTSKGWLPTIYLDDDGKPVDLGVVEAAADAVVEQVQPTRAASVKRVSGRVLAALRTGSEPKTPDVRKLRAALARKTAALAALNAAISAQQRENEEITILLLAS